VLLAVDIGNSAVSLGVFAGDRLINRWQIDIDGPSDPASWRQRLSDVRNTGLEISRCAIASVAPSHTASLAEAAAFFCGSVTLLQGTALPGVRALVREPHRVGIDRLLNCLACARLHASPAIVVDIGTAATLDFVTGGGDYGGGVIAPGPRVSVAALAAAAQLLPPVRFARPTKVLGLDTETCMQSGAYWGFVGLVRELLARLREEIGPVETVVGTGGSCALIAGDVPELERIDPDLTLRGIALAVEYPR
jgi:type III pantothenate kinase